MSLSKMMRVYTIGVPLPGNKSWSELRLEPTWKVTTWDEDIGILQWTVKSPQYKQKECPRIKVSPARPQSPYQ